MLNKNSKDIKFSHSFLYKLSQQTNTPNEEIKKPETQLERDGETNTSLRSSMLINCDVRNEKRGL